MLETRTIATDLAAATFARPLQSGRIIGRCPALAEDAGAFCWKFKNADPTADYDFWMIKTLLEQDDGQTVMTTLQLPAANGELVVVISTVEYERIHSISHVRTLKAEGFNLGVVNYAKMKVREVFHAVTNELYRVENDILVFGKDSKLKRVEKRRRPDVVLQLEEDKSPTSQQMLAGKTDRNRLRIAHSQLSHVGSAPEVNRIHFPVAEPIVDGAGSIVDFEVDGGAFLEPGGAAARGVVVRDLAPGMYIEFARQEGEPELNVTIIFRVTDQGDVHILVSRMCTGVSYSKYLEVVKKKKSGSWFKKKVKIKHIIKQLHHDGMVCSSQQYPFL